MKELPLGSDKPAPTKFFSFLEELRYGYHRRMTSNANDLIGLREKLKKERSDFAYEAHVETMRVKFRYIINVRTFKHFIV